MVLITIVRLGFINQLKVRLNYNWGAPHCMKSLGNHRDFLGKFKEELRNIMNFDPGELRQGEQDKDFTGENI